MHNFLKKKFDFIQAIRDFFIQRGFTDILTPPMVSQPGIEPHIHPFQVSSTFNHFNNSNSSKSHRSSFYLHSSPEFFMKELLSQGMEKIFTLSHSFRDEPSSSIHRNQFIMLEWYRSGAHYTEIMKDCIDLWVYLNERFLNQVPEGIFHKMTIAEVFKKHLNIDILNLLEANDLKKVIQKTFPDVPIPEESDHEKMSWDDYFFLLFLNKIEPELKEYPFLILYEFPHHLSALSTLKKEDPRVCERFEIYIEGIELANCFNELCDLEIQKKRAEKDLQLKKELYNYSLPLPKTLFRSLEKGLPSSSGIALGVERLFSIITKEKNPFQDTDRVFPS